jgi:putative ABC transport system permease protein
MFFLTYLRRELRRRMRQAIFIALGLAIGIGLVITVMGASSGVKAAQAKVLQALYGIGTDVTVTTKPKPPSGKPTSGNATSGGPSTGGSGAGGSGPRAEICLNGKCYTSGTVDALVLGDHGLLSQAEVARIAGLHDVSAAAGGLLLTDNRVVLPSASNPNIQPPTSFTVDGTDISHSRLGPLSNARLTSGRAFTAADQNSDVALVDANYAASNHLKVGSTTTIGGTKFKVIGLLSQPESSSPPNMYIPLARAQALTTDPGTGQSMKGTVDTAYVTAASAADIAAVQKEIEHLLPQATVTSSADLASEITGSAASAAKLAGALGKWLAVLALIAAFAVASLLTMAAVARRVPEFGTLKALGWRSRRIVGQLLGESVTTGIIGGLAGVGLGFAGVAIIDKIAPKLSATIPSVSGALGAPQSVTGPGGTSAGTVIGGPATTHTTIAVPMSASVTIGAIVLAVLLAIAGGLLAGSFGGWRAARLRPAAALARVA